MEANKAKTFLFSWVLAWKKSDYIKRFVNKDICIKIAKIINVPDFVNARYITFEAGFGLEPYKKRHKFTVVDEIFSPYRWIEEKGRVYVGGCHACFLPRAYSQNICSCGRDFNVDFMDCSCEATSISSLLVPLKEWMFPKVVRRSESRCKRLALFPAVNNE